MFFESENPTFDIVKPLPSMKFWIKDALLEKFPAQFHDPTLEMTHGF